MHRAGNNCCDCLNSFCGAVAPAPLLSLHRVCASILLPRGHHRQPCRTPRSELPCAPSRRQAVCSASSAARNASAFVTCGCHQCGRESPHLSCCCASACCDVPRVDSTISLAVIGDCLAPPPVLAGWPCVCAHWSLCQFQRVLLHLCLQWN